MHIFKSTIMPTEECGSPVGQLHGAIFGKRSHIAALNAVGRQVAREEGWDLLDMDVMTAQLTPAIVFRDDKFHPVDAVNKAALNVMLNAMVQREEGHLSQLQ